MHDDPVLAYANKVIAGEIPAGRFVRLACERHISDLGRDDLYFDAAKAKAVIDLFHYFPHTLGRWRGQEFVCLPYQEFIVGSLFGWLKAKGGLRRFRYAYVELARKNGKALDIETPIPVPGGWASMGSLKVGDEVFNGNGEPTKVVACTEVMHDRKCYRVGFGDGTSIVADAEHEWVTQDAETVTTKDLEKILPITLTSEAPSIVSCERVPSVAVKCIEVAAASGLYLAGPSMVPTHNSSLASRIALKLAFFDLEGGAEVYSAATTRDQAKIVWLEAMRVVRMSAIVRQIGIKVKESVNTLAQESTASIYKPLASNDESSDGLNIHAAVVDELQAHKNASCWNVLENATGARLQPMIFAITYAGTSKQSICWQQRAHAVSVAEGLDDDATFSYVAALDEGETWLDETVWEKANPSLGATITREYLRGKVRRAQELPAQMNAIRRAHFNEWTEGSVAWVNIAKWDQGTSRRIESTEYERAPCWGGLDLASNTDLTAFVLAFDLEEDGFFFLPKFWLPADNLAERVARDKVPYDVWARTGLLTLTEGNVCDYRIIRAHILQCADQFDLRDIAYDPYMATETAYLLQEEGVTMIPFRQGFLSMNEPTKKLERLILGEHCLTNGNPILRWNALNAVSREDPAGNIKLDKGRSVEKIDGIIALIMALGRATLDQGEEISSPRAMLVA